MGKGGMELPPFQFFRRRYCDIAGDSDGLFSGLCYPPANNRWQAGILLFSSYRLFRNEDRLRASF